MAHTKTKIFLLIAKDKIFLNDVSLLVKTLYTNSVKKTFRNGVMNMSETKSIALINVWVIME